jgi:1-acyl-sn-glycerol-3-phosphate acyltransferase
MPFANRRCGYATIFSGAEAGRRGVKRIDGFPVYRVAKKLLNSPLRSAFDLHIERPEHVPSTGPLIVVANHRSFMDSIFLALVVHRPVRFLAKAEYFDDRRTAWLFRALGQIPVRRGSPGGAKRALDEACKVLEAGGVVGLYPEGTRSRDGRLHAGNLGAARLSVLTGAPILPVGLIGTEAVQSPDQRLPRLGKRVYVRFGRLIRPDGEANPRAQLRDLTHQMMSDIAALCGQTYARRERAFANA